MPGINYEGRGDNDKITFVLDEPVINAAKFSDIECWFIDRVLKEERRVLFDLSKVEEIDPAALAGFLRLKNKRVVLHKDLVCINAKGQVMEMMQYTSMDGLLLEDY